MYVVVVFLLFDGGLGNVGKERQPKHLKNSEIDVTFDLKAMFSLTHCLKYLWNIYKVKVTCYVKVNRKLIEPKLLVTQMRCLL